MSELYSPTPFLVIDLAALRGNPNSVTPQVYDMRTRRVLEPK